jgi:hypothetical protein
LFLSGAYKLEAPVEIGEVNDRDRFMEYPQMAIDLFFFLRRSLRRLTALNLAILRTVFGY